MTDNNYEQFGMANVEETQAKMPHLAHYQDEPVNGITNNSIFRITKQELMLMFDKKNLAMPDN